MKNKVVITIVVIMLCLVGSTLCFIVYGNKLRDAKPQQTKQIEFNDKDYTMRMFKTSYQTSEGNYLISPYSIYVALSMVRDGGNNNTRDEISNLIGTDKAKLLDNKSVHIANAFFLKDEYKDAVTSKFNEDLKNDYKAQLLIDKFDTPAVINNWVDKETSGMIKKVMDDIDKDFVLGLANAIAIDVKWQSQFICMATRSEEFTQKNGNKLNVEMMHNTYPDYDATYIESDKAKGIIIPYEDETNLEYIAIRPNDNLDDYINSFSLDELSKMEENGKKSSDSLHINLSLPRYTYEFELKTFMKNLTTLGMKDAFDKDKADFTNIISKDNMNKYNIGNLYINQAIHKSFIELNETGTKAAAVTFFGFAKATAVEPKFTSIDIKFDKSFMYIIRDKNTKDILFIGVVDKPNEWKGSTCPKEE